VSFSDFPVLAFMMVFVIVFAFCLGVSLMIAKGLSDDQKMGLLQQLWKTYFGGSVDKEE
jgi:hypothetical protein